MNTKIGLDTKIGTCSLCGGDVMTSNSVPCVGGGRARSPAWCATCGATKKREPPPVLPVIEMEKRS
jgi:hypothetical protein